MADTSSSDDTTAQLRQLRLSLQEPVPDVAALVELLVQPLALLSLVDAKWAGASRCSQAREVLLSRFMGSLQSALLDKVVGVWWEALDHEGEKGRRAKAKMTDWFSPAPEQGHPWDDRRRQDATRIAVWAYQALAAALSPPSPSPAPTPSTVAFILHTIRLLQASYPLHQTYPSVFKTFSSGDGSSSTRDGVAWEAFSRTLVGLPGRVSNATEGGRKVAIPTSLERDAWYRALVLDMDLLIRDPTLYLAPLSALLVHFVRQSYISPVASPPFPPSSSPPASTFFADLLPSLLLQPISFPHWKSLFASLSSSELARVAESLLRHLLAGCQPGEEARAGRLMEELVGREEGSLFEQVLLGGNGRGTDGSVAQIMSRASVGVTWVGGRSKDEKTLEDFLSRVVGLWADVQFVKFSLVSKHIYITCLLVALIHSFPPNSPPLLRISRSTTFLSSITNFLSHPDRTIRHLGMLVAEVLSERTVSSQDKRLDFGLWDGDDGGRDICRLVRSFEVSWKPLGSHELGVLGWEGVPSSLDSLPRPTPTSSIPLHSSADPSLKQRGKTSKKTKPKQIVVLSDSDDSLTGYASASSTSSSRSTPPTPSDLDEFVADPTLHAPKKKKVARPVYLSQLGELLSSREEPEKLEVGLKWGEALVRRKRGFGLELEENSIYIAIMLANLNDNYELENFDDRKQGILNALVACSPRKVAPALIEQYFHPQYSLQQRSAILTALAMGAREAASLPTIMPASQPSVDWPSKQLPPALHRKFVTPGDGPRPLSSRIQKDGVGRLASGLSDLAIEKGRVDAEGKVQELQREKQIRVTKVLRPSSSSSLSAPAGQAAPPPPDGSAFKDVAAEFFILPLINCFWLHFQDESSKAVRSSRGSAPAAGAGLILSPLALSKLLATLSVLLHAARHSSLFLAVLAPETLELAITLGARSGRSSSSPSLGLGSGSITGGADEGDEMSVLGTSLDLALVVLDASRDLDGGRTLMVEHSGVVLACCEWAEQVFGRTEKGERVLGEGGESEGGVRRSSAGLCVVLAEIREKWARVVAF